MRPLPTARRAALRAATVLSAFALAAALPASGCLSAAYAQSPAAHAAGVRLLPTAECEPDDQACKDREANDKEAAEIAKEQEKTQAAAGQADKDIKAAGEKLKECPPGSASCMEKLTGKGEREESGISDMDGTIDSFAPDPSDNAASAVESTCTDFPASVPGGANDGQSAFPVSRLCSLLGS
ncbi:hypothetical protein OG521_08765 [Streptomyces sp. NBC_01463]|uniref:hypothetical protein n=1 Tax=Streptomyces sp. RTGN2 TaxID=3016525 RepID=UPI0025541231|nr:hypothetical protein [Streptomyces sp. RTGN2]